MTKSIGLALEPELHLRQRPIRGASSRGLSAGSTLLEGVDGGRADDLHLCLCRYVEPSALELLKILRHALPVAIGSTSTRPAATLAVLA